MPVDSTQTRKQDHGHQGDVIREGNNHEKHTEEKGNETKKDELP